MIETIINEINNLPVFIHVLILILLFVVSPLIMFPIMSIAFLSGLSYGMVNGLLIAILGYFIATIFYYYLGYYSHNIKFIKKKIIAYKLRYRKLYTDTGLFTIAFAALFIPFIILVPLLGLIKKRKRTVVSGLLIGSFPSIFLSVASGSMAQQFSITQNKIYILYAFIFILILYIATKILNKKIKNN
jgi:uncharacterized membrane protein YdjX (TVP38/TMEM64 family)